MSADTKIFTVDKFLGLNESADGETELKLGEASRIENFYITDGYNLKSRPGIRRYYPKEDPSGYWTGTKNENIWSGYVSGRKYLLWWGKNVLKGYSPEIDRYAMITLPNGSNILNILQIGNDVFLLVKNGNTGDIDTVKIFVSYEINEVGLLDFDNRVGGGYSYTPYIPLAVSGCTPAGGGTTMEPLNILTNKFRVQFTSEGTVTDFVLPAMTSGVAGIHIAGDEYAPSTLGSYNAATHTFTTGNTFPPGIEVVFVCTTDDPDLAAAKERFLSMPYHEYFNGDTDTRVFFYGDGTNVCYYTGVPAFGDKYGYGDRGTNLDSDYSRDGTHSLPSLYVPAGNEIAVDFSDSAITAMVRHYSRLLVFKPDGTSAITYEPITLADGSVIAGFYLRPVNREFGNEAPGQVALINNYPRSFTHGSIYEWRVTSYIDERYAKCVSQKIARTVAAADPKKVIVCDDGANKTYYVFLNDAVGTVLVNRYDLDVWTVYRSELATNVTRCQYFDGQIIFLRNGTLYCFDPDSAYDDSPNGDGDPVPIRAVWESGFMSFGAPYRRKYSSRLWLSLLPQTASELEVTVRTDKRSEYMTKTAGYTFLDFSCLDFSNFSFLTYAAPKIRRIQLKVKKFVYYKLILRVTKPGARATVLGYDQQVRYSSNVK